MANPPNDYEEKYDDDDAAFGSVNARTEPGEEKPRDTAEGYTDEETPAEGDIAEQYDDSDFVTDDAADVVEDYDMEAGAETAEGEYDPLADDNADPYPNADDIYDAPEGDAAPKKKGAFGLPDFKTMTMRDKAFYGIVGLLGLGGLYFAYSMAMGTPAMAPQPPAMQQQTAQAPAPAETAPEKDAALDIAGSQSTFDDLLNVKDKPAAEAPAVPMPELPHAPAPQPAAAPEMPQAVADTPPAAIVDQQQPATAPVSAAAVPPSLQPLVPAVTESVPIPAVNAQLSAQQQVLAELQQQLAEQKKQQADLAEQLKKRVTLEPLTNVTAPPPVVSSNDPAVNKIATDLGVRIAETNARIVQLQDAMSGLQSSTDALGKQNNELNGKTEVLSQEMKSQSGKLDELENKAPGPSLDTATVDQLRATVKQLEDKLAAMDRQQATILQTQQEQANAVASASQKADSAAAKIETVTAKADSAAEKASAAQAAAEKATAAKTAAATSVKTTPAAVATIKTPPAAPVEKEQPAPAPKAEAKPKPKPVVAADESEPVTVAPRSSVDVSSHSPKSREDLTGGRVHETAVARPTWVLRAATPTMAWLSPRPGSAELKRVAPGDTLEGIGTVLEIRQDMGRWTVIGTSGMVQ